MKDNCFTRPRWLLWLAAVAWLMTSPAQADPAGRIGRVAWLSGTLNLYNPDSGESFSAPRNQPLTSGDVLSTAPGTRAEIQIGALTVRLDANSSLDLSRIDDEQIRLAFNGGRLIVKLPSRDALNDFELTTRDGRFNAREPGVYRVDTDANSTVATAYYGALHFTASDSEVDVEVDIGAGQRLQFWYSGQTLHRRLSAANDDFAQWSAARDQRPASASAARYVSPEMTGAEDLDDYGDWSQSAEYGAIWTPRGVAAGWAPYQTGHWAWVAPWGWNWVGDEPWGFAPFHYGRWVQHRSAWAWVPGARSERPVYAPALVGWNARHGVAPNRDARPTSGWFPLGAREVYVPAYRSSENYAHRVNVPHRSPHDRAVIDPRSPAAAPHQESRRTMPGAPAGAPQRSERAQPESFRPAPVPQLAPVETRDRREHQDQAFGRRESERVAPTDRHDPLPAPRERPQPEAVRPVMRDPRGEAPPQAARQTAPQRVDTPPQAMREQRHEPPAAVIRPQGAEARPQRNEERQRPASNAQERRHRDDGERR